MDSPAPNWLNSHRKHLLILSSAGKPVFSLHEDFGSSGLALCALIRALASKTKDKAELVTGSDGVRLVFAVKGELLLVACTYAKASDQDESAVHLLDSSLEEPTDLLRAQLDMLYLHVLFHVTRPALDSLFRNNPSYDLAGLLGGTEAEMRALVNTGENELSLALDAVPVLPLPSSTRTALVTALDEARDNFAVFGFIIAKDGRLIAGAGPRMSKTRFGPLMAHTQNYLLLANFVRSNPQVSSTQTWAPLCLPLFDDSGHFQVYGSSVSPTGKVFFLLLIAETSLVHFHEASKRCAEFTEKMKEQIQTVEENLSVLLAPEDIINGPSYQRQSGPEPRVPLHILLRVTKDESNQYVETKTASLHSLFKFTDENGGSSYLVKRYSSLRYKAILDPSCRSLYDVRTRDAVLWYRESLGTDTSVEIMALFPPLTPQSALATVVGRLKSSVQKELARLYCFPTTM